MIELRGLLGGLRLEIDVSVTRMPSFAKQPTKPEAETTRSERRAGSSQHYAAAVSD